jgi:hypothetical protein
MKIKKSQLDRILSEEVSKVLEEQWWWQGNEEDRPYNIPEDPEPGGLGSLISLRQREEGEQPMIADMGGYLQNRWRQYGPGAIWDALRGGHRAGREPGIWNPSGQLTGESDEEFRERMDLVQDAEQRRQLGNIGALPPAEQEDVPRGRDPAQWWKSFTGGGAVPELPGPEDPFAPEPMSEEEAADLAARNAEVRRRREQRAIYAGYDPEETDIIGPTQSFDFTEEGVAINPATGEPGRYRWGMLEPLSPLHEDPELLSAEQLSNARGDRAFDDFMKVMERRTQAMSELRRCEEMGVADVDCWEHSMYLRTNRFRPRFSPDEEFPRGDEGGQRLAGLGYGERTPNVEDYSEHGTDLSNAFRNRPIGRLAADLVQVLPFGGTWSNQIRTGRFEPELFKDEKYWELLFALPILGQAARLGSGPWRRAIGHMTDRGRGRLPGVRLGGESTRALNQAHQRRMADAAEGRRIWGEETGVTGVPERVPVPSWQHATGLAGIGALLGSGETEGGTAADVLQRTQSDMAAYRDRLRSQVSTEESSTTDQDDAERQRIERERTERESAGLKEGLVDEITEAIFNDLKFKR